MQPDQTVYEMVEEILECQAKAMVERSGCSPQEALEAVLQSDAGAQLSDLRDGPHAQEEKSRDWQEDLLWERALERLEDMLTLDLVGRFATERHYTWVEGYLEWLEGKEARAEYYARLEEELANLKG